MEKSTSNIKEINNVNWKVVERILSSFYNCGSLKKSQITLKSGLKYTMCMRYLKWLNEKMDFIEFELTHDQKVNSIHLTPRGIDFCKNKIYSFSSEEEQISKIYLHKNIPYSPTRVN